MAWAAAIPIATAVMGGISGKNKAKNSNKPTRNVILPPSQLGGWQRLQEIMQSMQNAPQYHVGANNPYMQGTMAHLMGRAGIPEPQGGYGPNPYLQPGGGGAPAPTPPPPPMPGGPGKANPREKRMV